MCHCPTRSVMRLLTLTPFKDWIFDELHCIITQSIVLGKQYANEVDNVMRVRKSFVNIVPHPKTFYSLFFEFSLNSEHAL